MKKTPVKKPELTTTHMASLAAKTLVNPNATALEKQLAGALLTQAADKATHKSKR